MPGHRCDNEWSLRAPRDRCHCAGQGNVAYVVRMWKVKTDWPVTSVPIAACSFLLACRALIRVHYSGAGTCRIPPGALDKRAKHAISDVRYLGRTDHTNLAVKIDDQVTLSTNFVNYCRANNHG